MHILYRYVFFLVVSLFFSLFAKASEFPFINIVTGNWKPYNYEDTDFQVKGISTEIVKRIFANAGYQEINLSNNEKPDKTYSIKVFPWSRSYHIATTQPNVAIYTIIRVEPREKLFKWVCPLGQGGVTSLYKLKTNNKIHISSIEEAKKYNITTNKDSMDENWLTFKNFKNLQITSRVDKAIKLFESKRADLIAFDDVVMNAEFKSAGVNPDIAEKVIELFKTPPYLAFSLTTPHEVVEKFRKYCNL